jgi:anti-sigma B factor antagonist
LTGYNSTRVERRDGAIWVAIVGELDLASAPQFSANFPSPEPADRVVIDLTTLEFIDSVGIRALLQLDLTSRADGWALSLVGAHGHVKRVLEICHVQDRIKMFDDPAELDSTPTAP